MQINIENVEGFLPYSDLNGKIYPSGLGTVTGRVRLSSTLSAAVMVAFELGGPLEIRNTRIVVAPTTRKLTRNEEQNVKLMVAESIRNALRAQHGSIHLPETV